MKNDSGPIEPRSPRTLPAVLALLAILAASACVALAGNGANLPLDEHEVFVARTAEEMLARNDWIVPYLNGEPRVRKPPLCYWLVMVVDSLNGADGLVSEWEARAPSIILGVALVGAATLLGCVLFDVGVGLIAGMLLLSSTGFVAYTHSARPEIVYAALCGLGLLGFGLADRLLDRLNHARRGRWLAYGAWLVFGVATLAKGPHLPILLMAGWAIGLFAAGGRERIWRSMRPISGGALWLATWGWWYIALWRLAPGMADTLGGETFGRAFDLERGRGWRYLDPYYVYRTATLVLPWIALYIPAVLVMFDKSLLRTSRLRHIWWVVAVPMLVLHVSLGRRWYYMLPALAPLTVLMAAGAARMGRTLLEQRRHRLWQAMVVLHIVALTAGFIIFTAQGGGLSDLSAEVLAVAAVALAASVLVFMPSRNSGWRIVRDASGAAVVATVVLIALALDGSLWDRKRFVRRAFNREVAARVPINAALAGWEKEWVIEQHYGHRRIRIFREALELAEAINQREIEFLLVERPSDLILPADARLEFRVERYEEDKMLELWRVRD